MSETFKRILIGVVGIPLLVILILQGGIYFFVFSLLLNILALYEFLKMFENKNFSTSVIPIILYSIIVLVLFYFNFEFYYFLFLLFIPLITVIEIFKKDNLNPLNIFIPLFGIIYISLPVILMNFIINQFEFNYILYVIVLVWTCDTFAYFGGKKFGKRKLSVISPNKTIEGSAIGFLFVMIFSITAHFIFPEQLKLIDALIIGILTGIFAQFGDLFESMLKRYTGVKDSSNLIPGHGGILDRFDSLLFVTPIVFVYIVFIKNLF